jgi:hypothetical protein
VQTSSEATRPRATTRSRRELVGGRGALLALLAFVFVACDGERATREPPIARAPAEARAAAAAPGVIVAIGDLHGDLEATRRALRLAGAIDEADRWVGGDRVVVQLGDRLDRGDDERAIFDLFDRLAVEARARGGAVHALLGNHEVMNAMGDLRYVTPAGLEAFPGGRAEVFRPGGPLARRLAEHPTALALGDTLFVHGGLLPDFARLGVERINQRVAAWLRGEAPAPRALLGEDGPVWTRRFSHDPGPGECALARESLALLGLRRMVVGHTVQARGITAYCGGAVFAADVGLSAFYGGTTEVLELRDGQARVLR